MMIMSYYVLPDGIEPYRLLDHLTVQADIVYIIITLHIYPFPCQRVRLLFGGKPVRHHKG